MRRACRSAYRQLRTSPGFSITSILTLAIGIGVSTAMYSVLYAVVLQPLPFPEPGRLVAVSAKPWDYISVPTILDWQHGSHTFHSIAAYTGWSPRIESSAGTGHGNAILVSQNFLATLGAQLTLGHDFKQTGHEADCFAQAIVSDAYWRRMGGGSALASRTLRLDHKSYDIIGVLAASAAFEGVDALDEPAILTPIGCNPVKGPDERGSSSFRAIGRLQAGVSIPQAAADTETTQRNLSRQYPNYYPPKLTPVLMPLADYMTGTGTRPALFATMAACGMLLLISCSNLTNLLLARNTRRRSEFALRATLGATPRKLLRQMLAENGSLAITGALIGVVFSGLLVRTAAHVTIVHLPRLAQTKLNLPALLFAGIVTVIVALLLTALPAARSVSPSSPISLTARSATAPERWDSGTPDASWLPRNSRWHWC